MEKQSKALLSEQRRLTDRRARPTPFGSALRFAGRRRGFRRQHEGRNTYVDCPSPRVILLVFFVMTCSGLDALLTLLYIGDGGREANPFMAMALGHGMDFFVISKMVLTGAGTWLLAAHQQFPLAFTGLHGMAVTYAGLLVVHGALLLP